MSICAILLLFIFYHYLISFFVIHKILANKQYENIHIQAAIFPKTAHNATSGYIRAPSSNANTNIISPLINVKQNNIHAEMSNPVKQQFFFLEELPPPLPLRR